MNTFNRDYKQNCHNEKNILTLNSLRMKKSNVTTDHVSASYVYFELNSGNRSLLMFKSHNLIKVTHKNWGNHISKSCHTRNVDRLSICCYAWITGHTNPKCQNWEWFNEALYINCNIRSKCNDWSAEKENNIVKVTHI